MLISFTRHGNGDPDALSPAEPVRLILRPDVEDRSNHATTKAFTGPEERWPQAVHSRPDGFAFAPAAARSLEVRAPGGGFTPEPEWQYSVQRPFEQSRGLDGASDLFSPGYFTLELSAGETATLEAGIGNRDHPCRPDWARGARPRDDGPDTAPMLAPPCVGRWRRSWCAGTKPSPSSPATPGSWTGAATP